jgi:ubiquitin carboxyl-terminal hydrolase 8|tara:strand:+ start:45 stop:1076 length:1032 start_codon:yes stop_codon:yes gene_type:complete
MANDFDEYKDKGLTGLANVGNTCYLNSCMQVLSHTYELNDFLNEKSYKNKINRKPESVLLVEWDKLREMMWSTNCTIAPHGFVQSVQQVAILKNRDIFSGYNQNDIQEFLIFIIDCFHGALSREVDMQITGDVKNNTDKMAKLCYEMMDNMYTKEYSEMLDIFYGIHISRISSLDGEILSDRPEPFSILSLPMPDKNTLSLFDCMDEYCKQEDLFGEDAWMNDKTNEKEDVRRGIIFWSLPEVLIVDLKRWNERGDKNNKMVDVPHSSVDLTKYVHGYNKESYVYDLFGVCNHSGVSAGGHYHAIIRNANGKWYSFNDTQVNEVPETEIISSSTYCFFYRKKK